MSEVKFKPCPLCGVEMNEHGDGWAEHPGDDCVLSAILISDSGRESWNMRIIQTPAQPKLEECNPDRARLDALASNYWDLCCVSVPAGADDADVNWVIIEHHQGRKGDVEIARAYRDDPRTAIDRALAGDDQ